MPAAAEVYPHRDVPVTVGTTGLTQRRIVDLGRTSSMMCRVWSPGH